MSEQTEKKAGNRVVGRVVSDKGDKTITVLVERVERHPLYGKTLRRSTKLRAHDENNQAKEGDTVAIVETRPLSATKRFRLVEVLKTGAAG
ncbi:MULTISPECIES: 30S ribosomal protein S17 [Solimonas]|uniref:30S ribosomal protein S17 n=1 Tax=Solimonas TaxID=413435 RepID=UPI00036ABA26|nr:MULTISPECIES: 30S ribosomal protein S17 [Solimonas]